MSEIDGVDDGALDFDDGIADLSDDLAAFDLAPDAAGTPAAGERSREDLAADFAARGPLHARLVSELNTANAEREAREAAREALQAAQTSAVGADEDYALVLGEGVASAFERRMAALDDDAYATHWAEARAQGEVPVSRGGLGWVEGQDPRGPLSAQEQALLDAHRAERILDPNAVLAAVLDERVSAFQAALKASPAKAFALGYEMGPEGKYVKAVETASAFDLPADVWAQLQACLRGDVWTLPAGYTRPQFRELVASYAIGS
jgi:hypothetical protein